MHQSTSSIGFVSASPPVAVSSSSTRISSLLPLPLPPIPLPRAPSPFVIVATPPSQSPSPPDVTIAATPPSSQTQVSSQELRAQRVRNRGKTSALDAMIAGLEAECKESGIEVEPDLMQQAINNVKNTAASASSLATSASVGTIGFEKASKMKIETTLEGAASSPTTTAAASSPVIEASASPQLSPHLSASPRPSASPFISASESSPASRMHFASMTQMRQYTLDWIHEQCCVPTTAERIAQLMQQEYDVDEESVQTQLDKLVSEGKLESITLTLRGTSEAPAENSKMIDQEDEATPQRVDIMWLQPMDLPTIQETSEDTVMIDATTTAPSASKSPPAAALPSTPLKSPSTAAVTPMKLPPISSSTAMDTTPSTPASTPASSAPLTPASVSSSSASSSSNHLSKSKSSALKDRLSKSRSRTLLVVGGNAASSSSANNNAASSPKKVPWTELAAAAAASTLATTLILADANQTLTTSAVADSSFPFTPSPPSQTSVTSSASTSSGASTLSPEQRAAIEVKKDAALRKRKNLLTPSSSTASSTTTSPSRGFIAPQSVSHKSLTVVEQLQQQLRLKQTQITKLRAQKFIQVDPALTLDTERLTEKWTRLSQEVLFELLRKAQETRPFSMEAIMQQMQIDPKLVRWNETTLDFDES